MSKKLGPFFSLFFIRKRLSSSKKSFLRPYFPLIRGMFVFRSGLRFLFRALEVPEPRMRKRPFSFTKMETWKAVEGSQGNTHRGYDRRSEGPAE